jgi:chromosome segregation ATPase
MPHRWLQLEQLNAEITALRERIIGERRRLSALQTKGHKAYGHIARLRDLENSLRMLTSKRDNLAQRLKNRNLRHGSQAIAASHR